MFDQLTDNEIEQNQDMDAGSCGISASEDYDPGEDGHNHTHDLHEYRQRIQVLNEDLQSFMENEESDEEENEDSSEYEEE